MPPLPSRIGKYEVVKRLGRGGMGVVYLAKDPGLDRIVAVKVLSEDSEELRERFAREARSAASLRHDNIVIIFEAGEDDGHPFIAMEYLDGETMADFVRRRADAPLGRKLGLMAELCAGLGFAHRRGIVHRDIKPANLMITTDGTLKILDFGIARVASDASTSSGLTRVGTLIGSINYMSPEQTEGLQVDERSDIFCVGLVFYELLAYTRAFPGETAPVVLNNIANKPPRPLHELVPDIDAELEDIVAKTLAKDPAQRFQSLADVATALEVYEEHVEQSDKTLILAREPDASGRPPASGASRPSNWQHLRERRTALIESHLAAAASHLEAGRNQEAIGECEQALVINPDEARAHDLLQHAQAGLDEGRVMEWVAQARSHLATGSLTVAEGLIKQALELRPASAEGLAASRELQQVRLDRDRVAERARARRAIDEGVAHMAAGEFEAALRNAAEVLAFDPDHVDARRLSGQARAALADRDARQAHDKRANEVVTRAQALVADGDLEGASTVLNAFSPSHQLTTAMIVEVNAAISAREVRRQEEDREAERRLDATARVVRPATIEREDSPPDPLPQRKSNRWVVGGGLTAALLVGGIGWWMLSAPPGPAPPPPPPTDYSQLLTDAEQQRANPLAAIGLLLKIPANAPEANRATQLLGSIRSEQAQRATAARERAVAAKADREPSFLEGDARLSEANALAGRSDAASAVKLYEAAQQAFVNAASAGLSPADLMQQALAAHRLKEPMALQLALQSLARDKQYGPALTFLDERKQDAAKFARQASSQASARGLSETNSKGFVAALLKKVEADRITAPNQTQEAVSAYGQAASLYGSATLDPSPQPSAAELLRRELQGYAQRADDALKRNDVAAARAEIAKIQEKDAGFLSTSYPSLAGRVAAAETAAFIDARITSFNQFVQSEQFTQARAELDKIRLRDANYLIRHPELEDNLAKAEADRKLKDDEANDDAAKRKRAAGLEQARLEIDRVLLTFATEASKGKAGNVGTVCPKCEKDFGFTRYKLSSREFKSVGFRFVEPPNDTSARVVWETEVTQEDRGKRPAEKRQYNVKLTRTPGGWTISEIGLQSP